MKPANKDEGLSNVDVALFALHKLGGITKKIHTELIAMEAYKLSKDRFSWSLPEFRNFPDKTTVRYALESAKKLKLASGRAGRDKSGGESEGWQFTSIGAEWILENTDRIATMLNAVPLTDGLDKLQAERFLKKIKSERLFQLFKMNPSLDGATKYDFTDMLGCSPDAPNSIMKQMFERTKSISLLIKDSELQHFLTSCDEKFFDLMSISNNK